MTEPSFNQYAAPTSNVSDMPPETGYSELKIFSPNGRIGRLRYLAYLMGAGILINVVSGILAGVLRSGLPDPAHLGDLVVWIPMTLFSLVTGIKRSHDFNASGWWAIASLIPVVSLVRLFVPGTQGANKYGPPPPPNTTGVRVLAGILPVVVIVGIVAAIAIPQYAAYTAKARAVQQTQPASPQ